jgi:hypothetical protein
MLPPIRLRDRKDCLRLFEYAALLIRDGNTVERAKGRALGEIAKSASVTIASRVQDRLEELEARISVLPGADDSAEAIDGGGLMPLALPPGQPEADIIDVVYTQRAKANRAACPTCKVCWKTMKRDGSPCVHCAKNAPPGKRFRNRSNAVRFREIEETVERRQVQGCPYQHAGHRMLADGEQPPEIADGCPACSTPTFWVFYVVAPPPDGWAEWRAGARPEAAPVATNFAERGTRWYAA